jgi:hypothetical protein
MADEGKLREKLGQLEKHKAGLSRQHQAAMAALSHEIEHVKAALFDLTVKK